MYRKSLKRQLRLLAPVIAVAAVLSLGLSRTGAQKPSVIVLDDASPSADVTITLDNGAPGAVTLDMQNVAVSLQDASGRPLLAVEDARVTALGFQITQDSPVETLHLERIAGVNVAQVRVDAQPTLPDTAATLPAANGTGSSPALSGASSTTLDIAPAAALPIFVDGTHNRLSLSMANGESIVQLMDRTGKSLLVARAGGVTSSLTVQLAEGQYALLAASSDQGTSNSAFLTLSAGQPSGLGSLPAPQQAAAPAPGCEALVLNASVVRSGPGTAYSTLGVANAGERLAVGGVNREGGWMLVQGPAGTAWLSSDAALLNGACTNLAVYDIPLRDSTFQVLRNAPSQTQPFAFSGEAHEHEGDEEEGEYDD